MSGAGNDIKTATQDIQQLKQTETVAMTATIIADGVTQPSTGSNLYTSIADLFSKLDVFIKLVDDLSKVSFVRVLICNYVAKICGSDSSIRDCCVASDFIFVQGMFGTLFIKPLC